MQKRARNDSSDGARLDDREVLAPDERDPLRYASWGGVTSDGLNALTLYTGE
jgi:hypothetical protein